MAVSVSLGNLDITNLIATDGFKWERNDIDSPNTGRDMNGLMHRRIVAQKDKIQITCRSMSSAQLQALFNALNTTSLEVTYTVPGNTTRTATFYNSKKSAGIVQDVGSAILYSNVSFDLIEV